MAQYNLVFVPAGGIVVAVGAANATGTLRPSDTYRFTATTACVVRFGASAAAMTNGNFDFALNPGESVVMQCPAGAANATVNVIQVAAGGQLLIQRIDEGS